MLDLVRVTEAAAIAASAWIGSGNKLEADKAATEAMRDRLDRLPDFRGNVRIGEGKKDNSYGLFKGDKVGMNGTPGPKASPPWDIAVDPIDGTRPTITSGPEAISVIALAGTGTMFDTEENYMLKLAVGPTAKRTDFSLTTPLPELCKQVAAALHKEVNRMMVCILDRPRHQVYIDQMRALGVRIKLIQDCDVSGAIAACRPESGVDMQFGVGGAPEAVLTAAAIKCLGGFFMAQLWKDGKSFGPVMACEDLVRGPCIFAATGITDGSLLHGVRWTERGPVTNSIVMRSESGTVRYFITEHGGRTTAMLLP
jgi:fructose-1,6-bisphosphatase II